MANGRRDAAGLSGTGVDAISGNDTTSCTPDCTLVQQNRTVVETPTIHA